MNVSVSKRFQAFEIPTGRAARLHLARIDDQGRKRGAKEEQKRSKGAKEGGERGYVTEPFHAPPIFVAIFQNPRGRHPVRENIMFIIIKNSLKISKRKGW